MNLKPNATALRTSLYYGLLAALWVTFSNLVLEGLNLDQQTLTECEMVTDWVFVTATIGLLFFIIRRHATKYNQKILELERAEALSRLQKETLKMIADSKPLPDTLTVLLRGIEGLMPDTFSSIRLLDSDGRHLRHGAAPSLPAEYVKAMDGTAIGPVVGSCGTAAFRGSPVFVGDIANDPLWSDYKQLALPHGLRSCWSTPILDAQDNVLGTFALYHQQTGLPDKTKVAISELATGLATTAILKERAEKNLRENEERFRALVEQASDAILVHDLNGKLLDVNQQACTSLGYAREELLQLSVTDIEENFNLPAIRAICQSIEPGQPKIVLANQRRKNGTTFPAEVSLTSYQIRGERLVLAMARDISERKESEAQLAQSVSLLRATIESSGSGILVVNSHGKVTTYNQRFLEMWRISAKDAETSNASDRMKLMLEQLEDPAAFSRRIEELYEHPEESAFDTVLFLDGRIFERTSKPQRLGDKIIGRVWSFRDVTEQKRAEKSMRLQSVALETAANAIMITDHTGAVEWVNPAFTRSTGYALADCLGKNPRDFLRSGKQDQKFYQRLWRTILAGQVWQGELINRRKDGSLYLEEMTIAPLLDRENRTTHFVAIKQDITERKRMAEQVREAGERTKFYMNRMPLAFIAWDRNFQVTEWNVAAESVFGWTAAEAAGKHAFQLIVPADLHPRVGQIWKEIVADSNLASHSINDNITKDGRRITCEWRNTPWRDASGQICGCLSIVSDISDQIRADKERQNLEAQLRQSQKMEAIGQLSGGIAHDFNNLLTIIQGNVALLQEAEQKPAEIRQFASEIANAADRATSLTRQLLMFSRKQKMQTVNLDLNEVTAQMTKMLQRILGEDITLRSEYAPALPLIRADAGMIEQIILNLAVNARDAMAHGGRLTVRTSVTPMKRIDRLKNPVSEPHVCLAVTDTGTGIPAEILPHIFEPFFTTKEVGKGTGLGLATVYGIVQQHRGQINVTSEAGQGTTFKVYFPALPTAEISLAGTAPKPVFARGSETILLVEDEPSLRTFVSDLLQRCGYTVLVADSGPAALKIWRERREHIQLVFTDVIMPEALNGLELGRQLLAEKPSVKIIYTSGYTGDINVGAALVEGVNFIRKPFKPGAVVEMIRKKLDEPASGE